MAEFNKKMQEFVDKIRIFGLRFYMWPYWFYYQNKRFKEVEDDKNRDEFISNLKKLNCLDKAFF